MSAACSSIDMYEPLDIIGNGSFGIIRKVRRKADGVILARKELNFERMTERDRKQIVAEVNILKDLHHENIVRYHDRFVDRDAGILYILMEYCGGGDLSAVIKQCSRLNRPLPEDTIWSYFFQLLLALQHCHCPASNPGDSPDVDPSSGSKRQQILHRDLKPENVFLDGNNTVKLGDFGLSKALGQASFANTYVGTPYYMSPELMQEKSYDTKSDIWSLGCLIYELCALKPPFHEAKTHSELSMLIRTGRIPPLPKGYSHALNQIIKAMLNLNPAMRPSAQQLLQHERIDFARKVSETEKMLVAVKAHKVNNQNRERELQAVEAALIQREEQMSVAFAQKDGEIHRLTAQVSQADVHAKEAVARREEELRIAVMKREEEVRNAMAKREEEILEAVRKREEEINEAWKAREEELRRELADAIEWVQNRQQELATEAERLERVRVEFEQESEALAASKAASRKDKTPLEEVKNLLAPLTRLAHAESQAYEQTPRRATDTAQKFPSLETPVNARTASLYPAETPGFIPGSAMRGVVLTATGEPIATPRATELTKLIRESPKVGLNFRKIFDFESDAEDEDCGVDCVREGSPPSPTMREDASTSGSQSRPASAGSGKIAPTRLRRPSIRTASGLQRPQPVSRATAPAGSLAGAGDTPTSSTTQARANTAGAVVQSAPATPRYDPNDEENLPSPFLKRGDKERMASAGAVKGSMLVVKAKGARRSNGNLLRVMAATNSANNLNTISPSLSGPAAGTSGLAAKATLS